MIGDVESSYDISLEVSLENLPSNPGKSQLMIFLDYVVTVS